MKSTAETKTVPEAVQASLQEHSQALATRLSEIQGACGIESVHQARVASRRIRSALKLAKAGLPKKTAKKWNKVVRTFTKALGAARDLDVQIEFLEHVIAELPDDTRAERQPGLDRLLLRTRQARQREQAGVVEAVSRFESRGVLDRIQKWSHDHSEVSPTAPSCCCSAEKPKPRSYRPVKRRLAALLELAPSLENPEDRSGHHQMRLAAKRLRYTLEVYAADGPEPFKAGVKAAKKLQTLLGDIHDMDVWDDVLAEFESDEYHRTAEYFGDSQPFEQLRPGIEYLRSRCRAQRADFFATTGAQWSKMAEANVWDGVAEAAETRVAAGPMCRPVLPSNGRPNGHLHASDVTSS